MGELLPRLRFLHLRMMTAPISGLLWELNQLIVYTRTCSWTLHIVGAQLLASGCCGTSGNKNIGVNHIFERDDHPHRVSAIMVINRFCCHGPCSLPVR